MNVVWNEARQRLLLRLKGLLNKDPKKRLDWPDLLDHPFVKESSSERLEREQRLSSAAARAEASRAWKGEGGAIAGAAVYAGAPLKRIPRDASYATQCKTVWQHVRVV
jgi:hypothetical protein